MSTVESRALEEDSPARALVYSVAAIGLAISLLALLFSHDEFSVATIALALIATLPFLLYARLAIVRPGADAVIAGVLVLAVGGWGSIVAMGSDDTSDFFWLPLSLVAVELAVFAIGAMLRMIFSPAVTTRRHRATRS